MNIANRTPTLRNCIPVPETGDYETMKYDDERGGHGANRQGASSYWSFSAIFKAWSLETCFP